MGSSLEFVGGESRIANLYEHVYAPSGKIRSIVIRILLKFAGKQSANYLALLHAREETLSIREVQYEILENKLSQRDAESQDTLRRIASETNSLSLHVAQSTETVERNVLQIKHLAVSRDQLKEEVQLLASTHKDASKRLDSLLQSETELNKRITAAQAQLADLAPKLQEASDVNKRCNDAKAELANLLQSIHGYREEVIQLEQTATRLRAIHMDAAEAEKARGELASDVRAFTMTIKELIKKVTNESSAQKMIEELQKVVGERYDTRSGNTLHARLNYIQEALGASPGHTLKDSLDHISRMVR